MISSIISDGQNTMEAMSTSSEFNIRVICRFRPLSETERKAKFAPIAKFPQSSDDTVFVGGRVYVFDKVFDPNVSQQKVYDDAARQIVVDILNGYNGTIFAYGQTASGKTHTMEGNLEDNDQQGIIPRIVGDIFNHIYSMSANLQFQIKVSYFEIYMDKIRDLLDTNKNNLAVHEDKNRVPYVKGCTERFVASPDEVFEAIEEGKANRHVAVTNMNEHSSRSHSVFLIDVKQENLETNKKLTGRLYLVDLAGSEKVSKTGAEGSTLDEAKNINRSLSALGNVIASLADGTKSHVPYRDSKLTRILQESLGGNARTTVIICCSMTAFNECETKSTLYFGQRAKMIKNTVTVNEEVTAEEWKRRYDREHERVVRLRGQLAACERELLRWRSGQQVDSSQMVDFQYGDDNKNSRCHGTGALVEQNLINHGTSADTRSRANTTYILSNDENLGGSSITDDERVLIAEKQCDALYRQLDEKDDEINQLEQRVSLATKQQTEAEGAIIQLQEHNQCILNDLTMMQSENAKMKEEIKELLSALQELAVKCDQKTVERNAEAEKADGLSSRNRDLENQMSVINAELNQLKEQTSYHQNYILEAIDEITNELNQILQESSDNNDELSSINLNLQACCFDDLSSNTDIVNMDSDEVSEDLDSSIMKRIRLCKVSSTKLKVGIKHLREQVDQCNIKLVDANTVIDQQRTRIEENNCNIRELTARLANMKEAKEEVESQLQAFEKSALRTRHADKESTQATYTLETKADLMRMENELGDKRKTIDELRERMCVLLVTNQDLQNEMNIIRAQCKQTREEANELMEQKKQQEKSRSELLALEKVVAAELADLQKIRKLFILGMHKRTQMSKAAVDNKAFANKDKFLVSTTNLAGQENCSPIAAVNLSSPSDTNADDATCDLSHEQISNEKFVSNEIGIKILDRSESIVQKQKIEFLEDNLKSLNGVYGDLVKENAELKLEIPKLEERLTATYARLQCLENALSEAKESATKDRKKYMMEVNRIREAVKNRQIGPRRTGNTATIVKPITGGGAGAYSSNVYQRTLRAQPSLNKDRIFDQ